MTNISQELVFCFTTRKKKEISGFTLVQYEFYILSHNVGKCTSFVTCSFLAFFVCQQGWRQRAGMTRTIIDLGFGFCVSCLLYFLYYFEVFCHCCPCLALLPVLSLYECLHLGLITLPSLFQYISVLFVLVVRSLHTFIVECFCRFPEYSVVFALLDFHTHWISVWTFIGFVYSLGYLPILRV